MMVDITEISALVAATGVVIGVVYYMLDLRQQGKIRQTDLVLRLYSLLLSKEALDAWDEWVKSTADMTDWTSYVKKHGLSNFNRVTMTLEAMGTLFENGLIKIDVIDQMLHHNVVYQWEKMKPMVEEARKLYGMPKLLSSTEKLYVEMKKREQKPQSEA